MTGSLGIIRLDKRHGWARRLEEEVEESGARGRRHCGESGQSDCSRVKGPLRRAPANKDHCIGAGHGVLPMYLEPASWARAGAIFTHPWTSAVRGCTRRTADEFICSRAMMGDEIRSRIEPRRSRQGRRYNDNASVNLEFRTQVNALHRPPVRRRFSTRPRPAETSSDKAGTALEATPLPYATARGRARNRKCLSNRDHGSTYARSHRDDTRAGSRAYRDHAPNSRRIVPNRSDGVRRRNYPRHARCSTSLARDQECPSTPLGRRCTLVEPRWPKQK